MFYHLPEETLLVPFDALLTRCPDVDHARIQDVHGFMTEKITDSHCTIGLQTSGMLPGLAVSKYIDHRKRDALQSCAIVRLFADHFLQKTEVVAPQCLIG